MVKKDPQTNLHLDGRDKGYGADQPFQPSRRAQQESIISTPGAFRVRHGNSDDKTSEHRSVSGHSTESSDSEQSSIIVIPKASLVKNKARHSQNAIPIAFAEEKVEIASQPHSAARNPPEKIPSRIYRWSVLVCLLVLIGLFSAILFIVLNLESNADLALQIEP